MANHHPCAGHDCDHCWVCDDLGVCCAQVPNIKAYMSPDHFTPAQTPAEKLAEELKAAVMADSGALSMVELVRLDIEVRAVYSPVVCEEQPDASDYPDVELVDDDIAISLSVSLPTRRLLPAGPAGDMLSELQDDAADTIKIRRKNNG